MTQKKVVLGCTSKQILPRRCKEEGQLKTCLPWTVKRSFFNSFFTFYVFLSGFFKEFNINLLKSTTSKLEPLKGLPLLGFWLKLKRATIRQVFFFFFFLATIDNVNVYGFYSTYFKEAKNHFE